MSHPLFDLDLKRVCRQHYITEKAAINFPQPESTRWVAFTVLDRDSGVAKVSLGGIHYPDTTDYFRDLGITDVTDQLAGGGWRVEGRQLYMADHYREAAEMIVKWVLSNSKHCNVEIADWFPSPSDRQKLFGLLELAKTRLLAAGRLEKNGSLAQLAITGSQH